MSAEFPPNNYEPLPFELLDEEEQRRAKASIAEHCHEMLDSRRDVFVIGPKTFAAAVWREPEMDIVGLKEGVTLRSEFERLAGRPVPASVIRRILDWAENDWPMSLGDFLSGMFFGKEWDRLTPPWRLVPEPKDRMNAESLGFGHLYPSKDT